MPGGTNDSWTASPLGKSGNRKSTGGSRMAPESSPFSTKRRNEPTWDMMPSEHPMTPGGNSGFPLPKSPQNRSSPHSNRNSPRDGNVTSSATRLPSMKNKNMPTLQLPDTERSGVTRYASGSASVGGGGPAGNSSGTINSSHNFGTRVSATKGIYTSTQAVAASADKPQSSVAVATPGSLNSFFEKSTFTTSSAGRYDTEEVCSKSVPYSTTGPSKSKTMQRAAKTQAEKSAKTIDKLDNFLERKNQRSMTRHTQQNGSANNMSSSRSIGGTLEQVLRHQTAEETTNPSSSNNNSDKIRSNSAARSSKSSGGSRSVAPEADFRHRQEREQQRAMSKSTHNDMEVLWQNPKISGSRSVAPEADFRPRPAPLPTGAGSSKKQSSSSKAKKTKPPVALSEQTSVVSSPNHSPTSSSTGGNSAQSPSKRTTFSSSPSATKKKALSSFLKDNASTEKQDVEVRSAFTSMSRARKGEVRSGPRKSATSAASVNEEIPIPTTKEELLTLLKSLPPAKATSSKSSSKIPSNSQRGSPSKSVAATEEQTNKKKRSMYQPPEQLHDAKTSLPDSSVQVEGSVHSHDKTVRTRNPPPAAMLKMNSVGNNLTATAADPPRRRDSGAKSRAKSRDRHSRSRSRGPKESRSRSRSSDPDPLTGTRSKSRSRSTERHNSSKGTERERPKTREAAAAAAAAAESTAPLTPKTTSPRHVQQEVIGVPKTPEIGKRPSRRKNDALASKTPPQSPAGYGEQLAAFVGTPESSKRRARRRNDAPLTPDEGSPKTPPRSEAANSQYSPSAVETPRIKNTTRRDAREYTSQRAKMSPKQPIYEEGEEDEPQSDVKQSGKKSSRRSGRERSRSPGPSSNRSQSKSPSSSVSSGGADSAKNRYANMLKPDQTTELAARARKSIEEADNEDYAEKRGMITRMGSQSMLQRSDHQTLSPMSPKGTVTMSVSDINENVAALQEETQAGNQDLESSPISYVHDEEEKSSPHSTQDNIEYSNHEDSPSVNGSYEKDIFSFYSWSEARQDPKKIKKERKLLNESILETPLYQAYLRIEASKHQFRCEAV